MKKTVSTIFAALALVSAGCGSKNQGWSVSGTVADADSAVITIEGFSNGRWFTVDTLDVQPDGTFAYTAEAPAPYPDIMRFSLGDSKVYFPIDSVDELVFTMRAPDIEQGYAVSGTVAAVTMQKLDSVITAEVNARGVDAVVVDAGFKKNLFAHAFSDTTISSVYYLINKSVGGRSLFDISNPSDLRLYGAVAQRFAMELPDDPRTPVLESAYAKARQAVTGTSYTIDAETTGLPADIVRYDARGTSHKLSELAGKGKVVLLSFTRYDLESSPAYTAILRDLWEKYHDSGLEIYQLAFDPDESAWRMRSRELPWTAVWNSTTDGNSVLLSYNVGALPMAFVIDRQGTIASRVVDPKELETEIRKHI